MGTGDALNGGIDSESRFGMASFSFQVLGRLVTVACTRDGKRLVVRHEDREIVFAPQFRGETALQLVEAADKLLYKAKENGRNRMEKPV